MIWLFFLVTSSTPVPSLSGDGNTLTISGKGTITQEIARSVGTYGSILSVIVIDADKLHDYAFKDFTQMISISLPLTMSYIGTQCFAFCNNLQNFSIPENVQSILIETFRECHQLNFLHISSTVTSVDPRSFYRCYKLAHFNVSLNNPNFSTDESKNFLLDKISNTLYFAPALKIINIPKLPKIINSYFMNGISAEYINFSNSNVQVIRQYAFVESTITELILPKSLKRLECPFKAVMIDSISIPETIEYFHDDTLKEVGGLKKFDIGKNPNLSVFNVVNGTIYNSNRTKIFFVPLTQKILIIPKTVLDIDLPLVRSSTIEAVEVEPGHNNYSSVDVFLFDKKGTTLLSCPGGLKKAIIPKQCNTLYEFAFKGVTVEEVILNEGLITIGRDCFSFCLNLTNVTVPNSLYNLCKYAFMGINAPNLQLIFGSNLSIIGANAFVEATLKLVDLQKCTSITSLSDHMFRKTKIEKIVFHNNIKSIGFQTFISAKILSPLSFPNLDSIGIKAFIYCNISSVTINSQLLKSTNDSSFEGSYITEFAIPDSVETLKTSTFRQCKLLKTLTINTSSSLKTIESSALSECESLENIFIPKLVNSIAYGSFSGCSSLQRFIVSNQNGNYQVDKKYEFLTTNSGANLHSFPGGQLRCSLSKDITEISPMAFLLCSKLKALSFEPGCSVASIKESTFKGCTSLEGVDFRHAASLADIGVSSFADCKALSKVEFGASLRSVQSSAFSGCEALSSVRLPSGLASIGDGAFAGCSSLSEIAFCGASSAGEFASAPKWKSFAGVPCGAVFVPYGFSGEMFCGIPTVESLDKDCNFPSALFTAKAGHGTAQAISLACSLCDSEQ